MMGLPQAPDLRARMVALAKSFEGCNAETERERYQLLIAPAETPDLARQMLVMSGCALVVRGLWRLLGIRHRLLDPPYRIGHAVAQVVAIAREAKAWVAAGSFGGALPCAGDVVLVGGGADGGGPEHVFTLTSEPNGDGGSYVGFSSIDGGQRTRTPARAQSIEARKRTWKARGKGISDTAIDVAGGSTRLVRGWVDVDRLAACGEVTGSSNM